jgi:hypothetical protein
VGEVCGQYVTLVSAIHVDVRARAGAMVLFGHFLRLNFPDFLFTANTD